jgi:isopenicillin-N N-acyltransferase-like protein
VNGPGHLHIDGADPWRRGYERGRWSASAIARGWRTYSELFANAATPHGVTLDLPALALGAVAVTREWAPELVAEMQGVADGAGVPLWMIAALNARTEILAVAEAARAGECSAIVHTGSAPGADGPGSAVLGGQSWDWHDELADGWHVQSVRGDALGFAGITEHGILAKIGVNEAGVGVLFNILGHEDDGATGVPVHLVARKVLGTAASFTDAISILREAPVSASTVMTVVTADQSACVELSPAGAAVIPPDEQGWLLHTNHFVDPELARSDLRGRREPETYDRMRVLSARLRDLPGLDGVDHLAALLTVHPDDGAEVCCHPPVDGRLGTRWSTLATIAVEPAARRVMVHPGGPCSAKPSTWLPVTAPTAAGAPAANGGGR